MDTAQRFPKRRPDTSRREHVGIAAGPLDWRVQRVDGASLAEGSHHERIAAISALRTQAAEYRNDRGEPMYPNRFPRA
jgi:hypothetical protein